MSGPDFRELVGDDLPDDEAARLLRVHELLVEAGPPAELPPSLAAPPAGELGKARRDRAGSYRGLPRRRLVARLLVAAAIVAVVFGGGFLLGHRNGSGFTAERAIPMHSAAPRSTARASLELAAAEPAGNSPLRMIVTGLPDLGKKGYYELVLTRGRRQLASCGTFVVKGKGQTTVRLNAPYLVPADAKPGWVVVAHLRGKHGTPPVLLTT